MNVNFTGLLGLHITGEGTGVQGTCSGKVVGWSVPDGLPVLWIVSDIDGKILSVQAARSTVQKWRLPG